MPLLGQFWNIPIQIAPYAGGAKDLYVITVNPADGNTRRFIGRQYGLTWDFSHQVCYYSGNGQGGRSGLGTPDDTVIEGTYKDYITSGLYSSNFGFTQFGGCQ